MTNDYQKLDCLQRIGVDVYLARDTQMPETDTTRATTVEEVAKETPAMDDTWNLLQQEVSVCTKCELSKTRTQTVFGVGDPQAEWLLIGEAPGAEEDLRGEPFIGRAGKLLDNMLKAIGLDRSTVYIANIVKCRPPENRNPRPDEVEACRPYLQRQIQHINPKLILALGAVAASNLLNTDTPVGKLRGQQHCLPGTDIPLVVTYHPAYLLRSPKQKAAAWEDLQFACSVAGREIPS